MYRLVIFALLVVIPAVPGLAQTPPENQTSTQAVEPPQVAPQPGQTPAQPPAPFPADSRIAFVNLQFVFNESTVGKQGQERLRIFNDKLSAVLAARNKEIQGLGEKIKSQQGLLDERVFKSWNSDLQRLQREAQFAQQEAQVQSDQLQQEVLANFEKQIVPVIDALRVEKRLHAIFAVQSEGGGLTLLSFERGLDLSPEVVRRLNTTK